MPKNTRTNFVSGFDPSAGMQTRLTASNKHTCISASLEYPTHVDKGLVVYASIELTHVKSLSRCKNSC